MAVRTPNAQPDGPPASTGPRPLPQLLRRAWYGLNQAFRRRIAHLGITPDQYTVLRNLDDTADSGLTQSELTARMSSDPNTIASLVERMEEGALLRRETDPRDRRARRLRLAPPGRRKFLAARRIAQALQSEILEALPAPERLPFLESLEHLARACRIAAERGSPADEPPAPRRRRAAKPALPDADAESARTLTDDTGSG